MFVSTIGRKTASIKAAAEQAAPKRQEVVLTKLLNTGARAGTFSSHTRSNFGKRDTVVHEKNTSSLLLRVTD